MHQNAIAVTVKINHMKNPRVREENLDSLQLDNLPYYMYLIVYSTRVSFLPDDENILVTCSYAIFSLYKETFNISFPL